MKSVINIDQWCEDNALLYTSDTGEHPPVDMMYDVYNAVMASHDDITEKLASIGLQLIENADDIPTNTEYYGCEYSVVYTTDDLHEYYRINLYDDQLRIIGEYAIYDMDILKKAARAYKDAAAYDRITKNYTEDLFDPAGNLLEYQPLWDGWYIIKTYYAT